MDTWRAISDAGQKTWKQSLLRYGTIQYDALIVCCSGPLMELIERGEILEEGCRGQMRDEVMNEITREEKKLNR